MGFGPRPRMKRILAAWFDRAVERTSVFLNLDAYLQSTLHGEIARLKATIRSETPDNPVIDGFKVYCQNDEDGIIQSILSRIPAGKLSRTFVEIGCGNGLENNTHALVLHGYRGYWIDASADNIAYIRSNVPALSGSSCRLKVEQQFVDLDNILTILQDAAKHLQTREPDLFSLDIDGNDLAIVKESLKVLSPAVICVEYNAKFPPPLRVSIPYSKSFRWTGNDYQGASLQTFCDALTGYRLACCNLLSHKRRDTE